MAGDLTRFASFHDQFLLSPTRLEAPPGWRREASGGWHLISHPSLPVARLRTSDGAEAGFALGWLIAPDGRLAGDEISLPEGAERDAVQFEGFLYRYGGRFTTIVLVPGLQRVYVDPMGTLATVWSGERERVASSTSLLLHDEPDHALFHRKRREFPCNLPDQFFPGELTAAMDVRRLLPNHCLELRAWSASRHHPGPGHQEATPSQIRELAARFHEVVRRQIGAVIEECGGAYLALTAGEDSRRLLACARDFVPRLETVTLEPAKKPMRRDAARDVHTATRLAEQVGFPHRVIPMRRARHGEDADYLARIGFSGGSGKVCKFYLPPIADLDLSRAWMTGHGGGICSAKYFSRADEGSGEWDSDIGWILRAIRLSARPGFTTELERWRAELPEGPRYRHVDLAVLEHVGGGWASAHLYGTAPFRIAFLPMVHREAIDAAFLVSAADRKSGLFDQELLQLSWPELAALPYNEFTDVRRWFDRARRLIARPARRVRNAVRRRRHLGDGG